MSEVMQLLWTLTSDGCWHIYFTVFEPVALFTIETSSRCGRQTMKNVSVEAKQCDFIVEKQLLQNQKKWLFTLSIPGSSFNLC